MLVLSRKIQQQLVIADNVIVTVLGVKGQVVRLGIEAPAQVRVLRREIQVRYQGDLALDTSTATDSDQAGACHEASGTAPAADDRPSRGVARETTQAAAGSRLALGCGPTVSSARRRPTASRSVSARPVAHGRPAPLSLSLARLKTRDLAASV